MPINVAYRTARWLVIGSLMVAVACLSGDRPTILEPGSRQSGPAFVISDGAHSGGTPGFYFLPPMVSEPVLTGALDDDITTSIPWWPFAM